MTLQRNTIQKFVCGLAVCGVLVLPHLSFADDAKTSGKTSDSASMIRMHEHMSEMHKKAADCLKSGKSEAQCHKAMMSQCKEHSKNMKGEMNCPMMGKMGNMDGMGGMHEQSNDSDKK